MSKTSELLARIEQEVRGLATAVEKEKMNPRLLEYLAFAARFHRYSFHNTMLIFSQKPDATRVAGYRTWQSLNRYVRKGEKGIAILAPITLKKNADEEDEERVLRFRVVYVFDVSQTEGADLPEPEILTGAECEQELFDALVAMTETHGIEIRHEALPDGTYGVSKGGTIVLDSLLQGADRFAVLVHELAHELLHHGNNGRPVDRKTREIEAETVAHVVCRHFGLPSTASNYLAFQGATGEEVTARLSRVANVVQAIVSGLESHLATTTTLAANG